MTSICSYIFTAFYNWLRDNDVNPRLVVDVSRPGVQVPPHIAIDGVVLISIDHKYVENFEIWPTKISFTTRFNGKKEFVIIPYAAMSELVCSDTGISIPINMWLTSIELACHVDDEGFIEDNVPEDDHQVFFSVADDSAQDQDNASDTKEDNPPKKIKPNFTCVD